jgi:SsrA-binding protein
MSALVYNKKAGHNFELLKTYEAGISLLGTEVKSVRKKQGNLEGSHVVIRGDEAFLVGATIPPFQVANAPEDFETDRTRTLLLSKKQLAELHTESEKKGLTIVPIKLYNQGRFLKLEIAIARGKKQHDKRETLKARDTKRDIDRLLKNS